MSNWTLVDACCRCHAIDSSQSTTREDDDGTPVPISPSSLSYEAFVKELDDNDPFVLGLAEVLVKVA